MTRFAKFTMWIALVANLCVLGNAQLVVIDPLDCVSTNLLIRVEETERYDNMSKIRLTGKNAHSAIYCKGHTELGLYKVAKARGFPYFIPLKEWAKTNGTWWCIGGFTTNKDVDIQSEFEGNYSPTNDNGQVRRLGSVDHFDLLFLPIETFPDIKPKYRRGDLGWIKAYCKKRDIPALSNNCVRLFTQPAGIVGTVIEINLTNNTVITYPGTHSKAAPTSKSLSEEQREVLKSLLTSETYQTIPQENRKIGMDGCSYLIESKIDNEYIWKLHWEPDNNAFIEAVDHILTLSDAPNDGEMLLLPNSDQSKILPRPTSPISLVGTRQTAYSFLIIGRKY